MKIAVFISGSGSNLAALIQAQQEEYFRSRIELVVSDNWQAYGLVRAEQAGIDTLVSREESVILQALEERGIELVVLAGYLKILSSSFVNRYPKSIINIHPSLLPDYGGKGMYGILVHGAVLADKAARTGASVHYVTQEVDSGEIILKESMDIDYHRIHTAEVLQKEVLKIEHRILKEAIRKLEIERGEEE